MLPGQPFDLQLLGLSSLYTKSRELCLKSHCRFTPSFVSSARTLSSASLLDQQIHYSPIEDELIWAATDPLQKKLETHLLTLRTYSTSIFHEQNHRILWPILPPPPPGSEKLRKYLNFVESLVVTADMALGDELTPPVARFFHLTGVTYDPGTPLLSIVKNKREY